MSLSLASRSIDNKAWILNSFLTTLDLRMVVWCELEKNLVADLGLDEILPRHTWRSRCMPAISSLVFLTGFSSCDVDVARVQELDEIIDGVVAAVGRVRYQYQALDRGLPRSCRSYRCSTRNTAGAH
jgi:hypothetical protein